MKKYDDAFDGQWFMPRHNNFQEACCDCGEVHRIDFKVVKHNGRNAVMMRYTRMHNATIKLRKSKETKEDICRTLVETFTKRKLW